MNETEIVYCGEGWANFWTPYNANEKWARFTVTAIGTITNILNIMVFTRKSMASSPINKILAGLALADFLFSVRFIIEFLTLQFRTVFEYQDSYFDAHSQLIHEVLFDVRI